MAGLSRIYDEAGRLTHVMCPFCFRYNKVDEAYVDDDGQRWDTCGADEFACPPMDEP